MSKEITFCSDKTMTMINEDKALDYMFIDMTKDVGISERHAIPYFYKLYKR